LLLGGCLYGLIIGFDRLTAGSWPGGAAFIALLAGVVLTGGLHLDGLSDWADGLGGQGDRNRILAIMKDSRTGAFGVMALGLAFLGQWIALSRLTSLGLAHWIIAALVISRAVQVELAVRLPYARPEGGTGASFVEGARPGHRLWAWGQALLLAVGLLGPLGAAAVLLGWLGGLVFGSWCRARVGGITGDLLGAGSVLTESLLLLACAVAGEPLLRYGGWAFLAT